MKVVNLVRSSTWVTIDIDVYKLRMSKSAKVLYVESVLYNLLYAFGKLYVRVSSSGKGIHITIDVDESAVKWVREMYDDKKRLTIDERRVELGMKAGRYLFFAKGKKRAGQWLLLEDALDVERFVREFFDYIF